MRINNLYLQRLQPLRKRWYVVLICLLIATIITTRYLFVVTPMYQANATIKIDNSQASNSNNGNAATGNVQTEVEVLKSRILFEKALSHLDFNVEYFHNDEIKTEEVYHTAPFVVEYKIKDSSFYCQSFDFRYLSGDRFKLTYEGSGFNNEKEGTFGVPISDRGLRITIRKNETIAKQKQTGILEEPWTFTVHSTASLSNKLMNNNFSVDKIDKDVNILKIAYSHAVPEKAAKMVNAIASAYLEQSKEDKQNIATSTVDFLNKQLVEVGVELTSARDAIKNYREKNGIVNIPQQTESTYKIVGDLEVQKVAINLQLASLEQMSDYLRKNRKINLTAPGFESVSDESFSETVAKLNEKQLEREAAKSNPTAATNNAGADAEIEQLKTFLVESINNTRRKLLAKQDEIILAIGNEKAAFKNLPEKESVMQELSANYYLFEKAYNSIVEKRTDAILAQQISIPNNKIIEAGIIPFEPISPRKEIIWTIALLIGLVVGIILAYITHYVKSEIQTPEDLDPVSTIPLMGQIEMLTQPIPAYQTFTALTTRILMNRSSEKNMVITVTSTRKGEGKSYVAAHLARTMAAMDKKVLMIDANTYKPQLASWFDVRGISGLTDFYNRTTSIQDCIQITNIPSLDIICAGNESHPIGHLIATQRTKLMLEELKMQYDVVIIDTPEVGEYTDAIPFMKWSDLNLYVVKADTGKTDLIANAELIKEEYRLEEVYFVINAMKEKRNHTGYIRSNKIRMERVKRSIPQLTNLFAW